ncbi:MAG: hypothetical protein AUJ92_05570 [Armatimonadetes bacterium CG2_30_59_28]|nr:MAG: hypothetical protein AUJ92_05570 [Armatimonadetes bacterium CG2_30_59_28]PIU67089.1 MAG: hypothetical protein COS85_02120 [Armatimonadetes bacterium CG07_land_8_20_14_0_80_59_28]PIX40022.1 MAG: hypothetical protein COZ56_15790 [Armatimonadetes bacterium CG_4_8_14_3_um_filter_58_9]PJB65931.1 MAG: hypothetical protein CO095_13645 [Armatimonadetes bacterium CG_4_9_14_3_um_filter_58_7]
MVEKDMILRNGSLEEPFFSICIPQFDRVNYLAEMLNSLRAQEFCDYEVVVSDDCSTDGTVTVIPSMLHEFFERYVFVRTSRNVGYDANLRNALSHATGRYVLLMGNDDAFGDDMILRDAASILQNDPSIGVLIGNYCHWSNSGDRVLNFESSINIGTGTHTVCQHFRKMVFISGLVMDRRLSQEFTTRRFDGSLWYQVFIASKIILSGRTLFGWNRVTVRKDIEIQGHKSLQLWGMSSASRNFSRANSFGGLTLCRVAVSAVREHVTEEQLRRCCYRMLLQVMLLTYPFALYTCRRNQSYFRAIKMVCEVSPACSLKGFPLSLIDYWIICSGYMLATFLGMCIPLSVLAVLKDFYQRIRSRLGA